MEEITLPSGLRGTIRGLKVAEERILSDRRAAKSGEVVDNLLRTCWEKTTDPGPYQFTGAPDWGQVLTGDRFVAVLALRTATYGPDFDFQVHCEACGERFGWRVKLPELPVKALTEEARARFVGGNRFTHDLHGTLVTFQLLTGDAERRLQRLTKGQDNPISAVLAFRIVEIQGVEEHRKGAWLKDLPMRDATALLGAFDDQDCGVDTDIDVECRHCGAPQDIKLPFDQGFWMPVKKRRA